MASVMNNNWDELLDAASKRENIQFPECNFDFKSIYEQQIKRRQEEFNKLPPAPEGYRYVWIDYTYDPPRTELKNGWKLSKIESKTDLYISPEAMQEIKEWDNDRENDTDLINYRH